MNHDPQTHTEFVSTAYRDLLQREPDAEGLAYYVKRLDEGAARLDVVKALVVSQEFFELLCRQRFGAHVGTPFLNFALPGHFYSPIPSADAVEQFASAPPLPPDAHRDVDFNLAEQFRWLERLAPFARDLHFDDKPGGATRFHWENDGFAPGDAALLGSLLRALRPARILEIGAGYTTALMLDVAERHLDRATRITSVDPEPDRVRGLLRAGDEGEGGMLRLVPGIVQELPLAEFAALRANDILFIDSSHVMKLGSDVSFLLFQALPRLAPGVFVHVHDVSWSFEYPLESYLQGRAWNEAPAMHAFLAYNQAFPIVSFPAFLVSHHRERARALMPALFRQRPGLPDDEHRACSLWLRRAS
jgi:predicted O-methyltransferase YrrM